MDQCQCKIMQVCIFPCYIDFRFPFSEAHLFDPEPKSRINTNSTSKGVLPWL